MTGLHISDLRPIGAGVERPEQVAVDRDGRVFASDKRSAVAEILGTEARPIGKAGGEPNGICLTGTGSALIANFGSGCVQQVDLGTGDVRSIVTSASLGRDMTWVNFVLVDGSGYLWASCSTASESLIDAISDMRPDGFLIRARVDGSDPVVVADGLHFPNCMALDRDERYLYVVRTTPASVVRFPISRDHLLGPEEVFGPPLGGRRADEVGPAAAATLADPEDMRRWGMGDGCGFDDEGNLWVTIVGSNRIVAIAPDGTAVTVFEDPAGELVDAPTSVAWGGADMRDIYFGSLSAGYVVKGRSSVAGMRMLHQRS